VRASGGEGGGGGEIALTNIGEEKTENVRRSDAVVVSSSIDPNRCSEVIEVIVVVKGTVSGCWRGRRRSSSLEEGIDEAFDFGS